MNIKKLARHFFLKENSFPNIKKETFYQNPSIESFLVDFDFSNIGHYINEVKDVLEIDVPLINIVPYLVNCDGQIQVMHDVIFDINEQELEYTTGFYNEKEIYIGRFSHMTKEPLSDAEILITIIHELRHCWQAKYKHDKYFNGDNAIGIQHIRDNSEIDADAFAIAYMNSKTQYDRSTYMLNMNILMAMDGGSRKERIVELCTEYDFRG